MTLPGPRRSPAHVQTVERVTVQSASRERPVHAGWPGREVWFARDDDADPSVLVLTRFDVRQRVVVEERKVGTGGAGVTGDVHLTADGKHIVSPSSGSRGIGTSSAGWPARGEPVDSGPVPHPRPGRTRSRPWGFSPRCGTQSQRAFRATRWPLPTRCREALAVSSHRARAPSAREHDTQCARLHCCQAVAPRL